MSIYDCLNTEECRFFYNGQTDVNKMKCVKLKKRMGKFYRGKTKKEDGFKEHCMSKYSDTGCCLKNPSKLFFKEVGKVKPPKSKKKTRINWPWGREKRLVAAYANIGKENGEDGINSIFMDRRSTPNKSRLTFVPTSNNSQPTTYSGSRKVTLKPTSIKTGKYNKCGWETHLNYKKCQDEKYPICAKKRRSFSKRKKSSDGFDSKKYNEYCIPNGKTKRNTGCCISKKHNRLTWKQIPNKKGKYKSRAEKTNSNKMFELSAF